MASPRGHGVSALRMTNLSESRNCPVSHWIGDRDSLPQRSLPQNSSNVGEPLKNMMIIGGLNSSLILNQNKRETSSPATWSNGDVECVYLDKSGWVKMQQHADKIKLNVCDPWATKPKSNAAAEPSGSLRLNCDTVTEPKKTFRPDYLAIPKKKIGYSGERCKSSSPIDRCMGRTSPHSITPIISPPPAFKDSEMDGELWRSEFEGVFRSPKKSRHISARGANHPNRKCDFIGYDAASVGKRGIGLKSHASDSSLLERENFGETVFAPTPSLYETFNGGANHFLQKTPKRLPDGHNGHSRFSPSSTLTSSTSSSSASSASSASSSSLSSPVSSPTASPKFDGRRNGHQTSKMFYSSENNFRVKRSRSLQLSEDKRLNSIDRMQTHGHRRYVRPEPKLEENYPDGQSSHVTVSPENVNVHYSDVGQLRRKNEEFLRQAAEEARIVSDFLSGTRSRKAARSLLYSRYLNRSEDDEYYGGNNRSLEPEYGVHFLGTNSQKPSSGIYGRVDNRGSKGSDFMWTRSGGHQATASRFTGSSPSILDEFSTVRHVKAKPQKYNVRRHNDCLESKRHCDGRQSDCSASSNKSQGMRKLASQFQAPPVPVPVPLSKKDRQRSQLMMDAGEKYNEASTRSNRESIQFCPNREERKRDKFIENNVRQPPLDREESSVNSTYPRKSRRDELTSEPRHWVHQTNETWKPSTQRREEPGPFDLHRRSLSLPKSFRSVKPNERDYIQSTQLPEKHVFEHVTSVTRSGYGNMRSKYQQPMMATYSSGTEGTGSFTGKSKPPTTPSGFAEELPLAVREPTSQGIVNDTQVDTCKTAPTTHQEIPPSRSVGPSESVLGKFRKGVLIRLRGKGKSFDYFVTDVDGKNSEGMVQDREKIQTPGNSNLKLRFGSLMWKPGKDGKKSKKHAGNGECSSVDSGIQIECSGNTDDYSEYHNHVEHQDESVNTEKDEKHCIRNATEACARETTVVNQLVTDSEDQGPCNIYDGGKINFSRDKKKFLKNKLKQNESKNRFWRQKHTFRRGHIRRTLSYPARLDDMFSSHSISPSKSFELNVAYSEGEQNYECTSEDEAVSVSESLIESPTGERKKMDSTHTGFEKVLFAEALWDHVAIEQDELPFGAGDTIQILDTCDRDWWWGKTGECFGYFPSAFVRVRVHQDEAVESESLLVNACEKKVSNGQQLPSDDQVRSSVVRELLNTERHFVGVLNDVVEGYVAECRKRPDLFTTSQIGSIFSNLEQLMTFQKEFLRGLEGRVDPNSPYNSLIGEIFLVHRPGFQMYSEYCNSHPMSIATLQELYKSNEYVEFFERCRLKRGLMKIPLDGYLLTPVQRICKYPLQLAELLKYTKPDHPDHEKTREALDVMKKVATLINERKRKMESLEKLFAWQCRVDGWEGEDLIATSSQLIHQSDAVRLSCGVWISNVTLFLFDHQIVYCKKDLLKRNAYVYKGRISLDYTDVVDLPDGKNQMFGGTVKHGIQIYNFMDDSWIVFCCRSDKDKMKWLEVLLEERKLVAQDKEEGLELTKSARKLAKISAFAKGRPNKPKTEFSYPYKRFFKTSKR